MVHARAIPVIVFTLSITRESLVLMLRGFYYEFLNNSCEIKRKIFFQQRERRRRKKKKKKVAHRKMVTYVLW